MRLACTRLACTLVLSVALTLGLALGEGSEPPALAVVRTQSEQVVRGAHLYDLNCAVCHGDTGLGYEQARSVFPESHQRCERCHRPRNPAVHIDAITNIRNAFSIGDPPALQGEGRLAAFPTAQALFAYLQATMPRYEPGRLERTEYLDLTAFLLDINGLLPQGVTVSEESAATIPVSPSR